MDLDNVADANGEPAESRSWRRDSSRVFLVFPSRASLSRRSSSSNIARSIDRSHRGAAKKAKGKETLVARARARARRGTLLVINMYKVLISCRASERGRAGDRAIRRN